MLQPEYLDSIAEPIKEIYSELETKIMMDISRRIAGANYVMTPSAEWQIYKLQQMGMSQEYIQQEIAKTLEASNKAVNKIFKEAGIKSIKTDIKTQRAAIEAGILAKDTIPLSAAEALTQLINENARRTNNTLRKLTKTMALDANGKINKYLDMCQLMVQSGAFTQEAAIEATVRQFSREGIGTVDYASGMSIAMEAAVRRACVTGINQATSKVSLNNAELLGTDLVEVTSHADARPDHAEWQGQIYSISGNSKKYRKLSEATGYGTVSGLCGANCRHSFYAFIEGVSKRVQPEKYDQERYEAEQKQRYNERKIREWKKRAATVKAAGYDATLYDNKVAEWQAIQRKHLEATGLKRDYNREKIAKVIVKPSESGIIISPNKTIMGHKSAPPTGDKNSIIDHVGSDLKIKTRTFYDENGYKLKDINTTDHSNPKMHPYGEHGEHGHDYIWKDNKIVDRTTRELTDQERKENGDIL